MTIIKMRGGQQQKSRITSRRSVGYKVFDDGINFVKIELMYRSLPLPGLSRFRDHYAIFYLVSDDEQVCRSH